LKRLLAAGVVLGGYSAWEAHRPVLERIEIRLRKLPAGFDGYTIAQLTDIHYNEYLHESYYRHVVERVNDLRPDLIALTGDFITTPLLHYERAAVARAIAPPCAEALSG
jgi:predicted MPP superfamily phosphohydrolase